MDVRNERIHLVHNTQLTHLLPTILTLTNRPRVVKYILTNVFIIVIPVCFNGTTKCLIFVITLIREEEWLIRLAVEAEKKAREINVIHISLKQISYVSSLA